MDIRDRLIEEILQTLCYDDMTEDQLKHKNIFQ